MFSLQDALFAYAIVGMAILAGRFFRQRIALLRSIYLPSSIVAGVLLLVLGSQVLGAIASNAAIANGLFSEATVTVWKKSPSVFINVVFATLFLGERIPQPAEIWRKAAPQVAFGQSLAWGQYVVGLAIAMAILQPVFGMSPIAGTLIEIGFEGGHGTAGGMGGTLAELGFAEGGDLALGMATVGIVSGVVFGTALIDWGRRRGDVTTPRLPGSDEELEPISDESAEVRRARLRLQRDLLVDPLSLNLGFAGIAIALGWLLLKGLVWLEAFTWGRTGFEIATYVPLFPFALIGGILVQVVTTRLGLGLLIDRRLMERIAGVALDVTVVTAIASISLQVLGSKLVPFAILAIAGIAWNVLFFVFFARRIFPDFWFERGIGDLGQSMGVTSTGILLVRMADPENKSRALESFGYKQLFFEPIVGGGLFTAAAPSLVSRLGALPVFLMCAGLLAFWLIFGLVMHRQQMRKMMDA